MQILERDSNISELWGVGDSYLKKLNKIGIFTVKDLLFTLPFKYKDTRDIIKIDSFLNQGFGTFEAKIEKVSATRRGRYFIINANAVDETGKLNLVWFNQPYILVKLKEGRSYFFEGKISNSKGRKVVNTPEFELVEDEYSGGKSKKNLGNIISFYQVTAGLSSKWLRSRIKFLESNIDQIITDGIPRELLHKLDLLDLPSAIKKIHFPENEKEIDKARERLAFDEFLNLLLDIEIKKQLTKKYLSPQIEINRIEKEIKSFIGKLDFSLTNDQLNSIKEIFEDLKKSNQMKRLLNGDVGSGKTVVAFIVAYALYLLGYSSIIMAPTTILAQQHFNTFTSFIKKSKLKKTDLILVKSKGKKDELKYKEAKIIIGTHALLYKKETPSNLALVIVDEQHRFGVEQREQLLNIDFRNETEKVGKSSFKAHYLSMSATPIPRTLTNVIYGDMSVSYIKLMPKNRKKVKSYFIENNKRDDCFEWVKKQVKENGDQAYIVYPLIEESAVSDTKSAIKSYELLSKTTFKDLKIELLHGRIKEDEKNRIIKDFKNKKIDILISTSVIEVGMDISNATIMIIEGAERFGLAQLHQLRGRVGRGEKQAYCFVITSESLDNIDTIKERLKYFASNNDGFEIAEYDLQRRGPGEVYGKVQSGIPDLKVANIMDIELIKKYREIAKELLQKYTSKQIEKIRKNIFK